MRLLLVSDLHYTLKQMDWVARVAPDFDVVVVAGDHLDAGSFVDHDAQIVVVREFLRRLATRTTVVASSGNHDLNARDANGEKSAGWLADAAALGVHADGTTLERDDALITVCKWWDGPRGRDAVAAQLATDARRRDERAWIWVYHAPPDASPTSWTGRRHYGDAELRSWIAEHGPDLVLTGHVHESPFAADGAWSDCIDGTWVVNAGRQRGPVPCHVELELHDHRATWHSLMGAATAELSGRRRSA